MGIINLNSSIRYSHCGRKRKTKAFTVKKKPPVDFKTTLQYKETIRRQEQQYKSTKYLEARINSCHLIKAIDAFKSSSVSDG